jgi:hypothetical protein
MLKIKRLEKANEVRGAGSENQAFAPVSLSSQ